MRAAARVCPDCLRPHAMERDPAQLDAFGEVAHVALDARLDKVAEREAALDVAQADLDRKLAQLRSLAQ